MCSIEVKINLMEFDNKTFFIANKTFYRARLAQWGTDGRDVGTYEQGYYPDQLWMLKMDPKHPNYYTIENLRNPGYRIAKWGGGDRDVGVYKGQYFENQLWRFNKVGDDEYRIYNYAYKDAKIGKWGKGDGDWGTYDGPDAEDQIWKLIPRFTAKSKGGNADWSIIWKADNTQGTQDFSEMVEVTQGINLNTSKTFSVKTGIDVSLEAAIPFVGTLSTKISTEISKSYSQSEEKSWSRTSRIEFTAPAGKNYCVRQLVCDFESKLVRDNCQVKCEYKIEEV